MIHTSRHLDWRLTLGLGLLTFLAWMLLSGITEAQTLTNPATLVFTASADHDATDMGTAILSDYAVEFLNSVNDSVGLVAVGKPTPGTNRDITVDLAAIRGKLTVAPGTYTLRVLARGPGGQNLSPLSVPFRLAPRAPAAPGAPRLAGSSASLQPTGPSNGPSLTVAGGWSGKTPSDSASGRPVR